MLWNIKNVIFFSYLFLQCNLLNTIYLMTVLNTFHNHRNLSNQNVLNFEKSNAKDSSVFKSSHLFITSEHICLSQGIHRACLRTEQ